MGLFRRKAAEEEDDQANYAQFGRAYIDLGILKKRDFTESAGGPSIRFADIDGYREIPALSNYVYDGNILVLDFTPIANDDLELKRAINELKRVVEDVQGDIAGISQNLLLVTPKGFTIDKKKMKKVQKSER
ncbi:MAG: cell division protein SepF [Candidatus Thermoplasmatota archaeon]|jgi:hypothetical protein|nr:cell division protein SepF [Candidatus Thermoplasmatota archaeon]